MERFIIIIIISLFLNSIYSRTSLIIFDNQTSSKLNVIIQANKINIWDDIFIGEVSKNSRVISKMTKPTSPEFFITSLFLEISNSQNKVYRYTDFIEDTIMITFKDFTSEGMIFDNEKKYKLNNHFNYCAKLLNQSIHFQSMMEDTNIKNNAFYDSAKMIDNKSQTFFKEILDKDKLSYFSLSYIYSNLDLLIKTDKTKLYKSISELKVNYSKYYEFQSIIKILDSNIKISKIDSIELTNLEFKNDKIICRNSSNIILLYIWTTGCPPCYLDYKQFNNLSKLDKYDKYSLYVGSDFTKWQGEILSKKIKWKSLADLNIWSSIIKSRFNINKYPVSILYNCSDNTYKSYDSLNDIP